VQRYSLWCGYAGRLFEVKIETDSNDISEYSHGDKSRALMFVFFISLILICIFCTSVAVSYIICVYLTAVYLHVGLHLSDV